MKRTYRPKVSPDERGRRRLVKESEDQIDLLVEEMSAELLAQASENLRNRIRFVSEHLREDLGEQEVTIEITDERPFFAVSSRLVKG